MVLGYIPTVSLLKPKCMMIHSKVSPKHRKFCANICKTSLNSAHNHYCVILPAIHEGFPQPILIGKPITLTLTRSSQKTLPPQIPGHTHCG